MVGLIVDCLREEVPHGIAKGEILGDGKVGIMNCGYKTNPDTSD